MTRSYVTAAILASTLALPVPALAQDTAPAQAQPNPAAAPAMAPSPHAATGATTSTATAAAAVSTLVAPAAIAVPAAATESTMAIHATSAAPAATAKSLIATSALASTSASTQAALAEPMATPSVDQTLFLAPPAQLTATASVAQVPAGPTFHLDWPPRLPSLVSIEAVVGPRFGQSHTFYPGFQSTTVAGQPVTDLSNPSIGSETSSDSGSLGGNVKLDLNIPILAPELGIDFDFLNGSGAATSQVLDTGNTANNKVADVLPSRTLGIFGRLLGLTLEYENLNWAQGLPDSTLGTSPSANVGMVRYDIDVPLGPLDADFNVGLGAGKVGGGTATASAVVVPADGKLSLALTLYGIKLEAGVRGDALAYGNDFGKLGSIFNLSSLAQGITAGPGQTTNQARDQVQAIARASYTWGPFVQAGISF